MSYCRFQNTVIDLQDCADTLSDLRDGEEEELSSEELRAKNRLIQMCADITEEFGEEE